MGGQGRERKRVKRASGWFWDLMNSHVARSGAPGGTRTPNPLLRRQMLYPIELRAHKNGLILGQVAEFR